MTEKPPTQKSCSFGCGKTNWDEDDVDTAGFQRWEYASGLGSSCYPCSRVWKLQLAHRYTSRSDYQTACKTNMTLLEEHRQRRKAYLDARSDGDGKCKAGWESVVSMSLRTREEHAVSLLPPADDFLPLDQYHKQFGDPTRYAKRGHKVTRVNGVVGVAMPAQEGTPWKLQRRFDSAVEKSSQHDVGEDSDGDPAWTQAKFTELVQEREKKAAEAAKGIMMSLLQDVADEEPSAAPPSKRMKKAIGAQDAAEKPKTLTSPAFGWGPCEECVDQDELAVKRRPGMRNKKSGKSGGCGICSVACTGGAAQPASDLVLAGDGDANSGLENAGAGKGRGRPCKDIVTTAADLLKEMETADEASVFFGDRSEVMKRALVRYIKKATPARGAGSVQDPASVLARKQLMMMEKGIRIWKRWFERKATASGVEEFISEWKSLMAFCTGEPIVKFQCTFLSNQYMQVQCFRPNESFLEDLSLTGLRATFGNFGPEELRQAQRRYVKDLLVKSLSSVPEQPSPSGAAQPTCHLPTLVPLLEGMSRQEKRGEFANGDEVAQLFVLVCPWPKNPFDEKHLTSLKEVLCSLPTKEQASHSDGLLAQIVNFPRIGYAILLTAEAALDHLEAASTYRGAMTSRCSVMRDMVARAPIGSLSEAGEVLLAARKAEVDALLQAVHDFDSETALEHSDAQLALAHHLYVAWLHMFCRQIVGHITMSSGGAAQPTTGSGGVAQPSADVVAEMLKAAETLLDCAFPPTAEKDSHSCEKQVVQHCKAWLQLWHRGVVGAISSGDANMANLVSDKDMHELAECTSHLKDALEATEVVCLLDLGAAEAAAQFAFWQAEHVEAPITMMVADAVKGPMEQLLGQFRAVATLLADEEKHGEIPVMDREAEEAAESVLQKTAGILATSRAQFLMRFLRMTSKAKHMQDMLQKVSVLSSLTDKVDFWGNESTSVAVFGFGSELEAFRQWVDASRHRFSDILLESWSGVAQPASEKAVHDGLRFAAKVMAQVTSSWTSLAQEACDEVKAAAPPSILLESPKLFSDEGMQKAFAEHMRTCHLPAKAKCVAVMAKFLKDVAAAGVTIEGATRTQSKLELHRNLSRRCLGANFALQRILEMPKAPKDIPDHARKIIDALKVKGIGPNQTPLPNSFHAVLERMQRVDAE